MNNIHYFNTDFNSLKAIKQVNKFRLFDIVLGKGSFGEVVLAWDVELKQLVALKLIPQYRLTENKLQLAFTREIKALNELRHPNIIKVLSLQKTVNNMYVALEFCNAGTLSELLKYFKNQHSSGIPEDLVQKILIQIVDGLSYMHQKGIIHRDMKLENILLTYPRKYYKETMELYQKSNFEGIQIKIGDLGFSRTISEDNQAHSILGTPINFAPEIVDPSNSGYNFLADLWSLGAITYEMIIGTPPFIGRNYNDVMTNIKQGVYKYPSNCVVSVESVSFINCLLTYDTKKRLSAEDIRNHPFLKNNPSTFNPMTLSIVPNDNISNDGKISVDSKDFNNFIWVMFRNKGVKDIHKVNDDDLQNKEVLQSFIGDVERKNSNEKVNLLDKFRVDKMKNKEKEKDKVDVDVDEEEKAKAKAEEEEEDENKIHDEYVLISNDKEDKLEERKEEIKILLENIENQIEEEVKKEDIKEEVDWDTYSIVDDKVDVEVLSEYVLNMDYIRI